MNSRKQKLIKDRHNVRVHDERNKQAIRESLTQCGTGRSIVCDSDNVIIGGNGVFEEAQKLGIPVRIIESDGSELIAIRRTDLKTDDLKRKALAIAGMPFPGESEKEEKPEVEFSEELLESHNYIVLYFDNDLDWLQAQTLFQLKQVRDSIEIAGNQRRGVGRVLRGADALNKLLGGLS